MTQRKRITLTASFRIVTPMFCAGADQNIAELRLPSFKGALRFWWRSLMWGKVKDHRELHKREAELFGASDSKTGQSKVGMRMLRASLDDIVKPPAIFENGNLLGAHYLGYGAMEAFDSSKSNKKAGQLTRAMIPSGSFSVECRFSRFASNEQIDTVRRAMILLGTAGGLGSKSRKGFGSLTLTTLQQNVQHLSLPLSVENRIREAVGKRADGPGTWTAWSRESRVVIARDAGESRPVALLDSLGREQVYYRSWGRNGRVLGRQSERNFALDHDLSKGHSVDIDYPLRVAFGLPHNYGKGSQNAVEPDKHDRRASPLFIHVHQVATEDEPVAVLAFLPALFLPDDEPVRTFDRVAHLETREEFWFPLHGYLDRLTANGQRPLDRPGYDRFPGECEWWKKQTGITAQEVNLG